MRFSPRRQSGFALLITLAVVMLAGVLLVGLARRSMNAAMAAENSLHELQRRWATIGCQAVMLDHAERIMSRAEESRRKEAARRGIGGAVPVHAPVAELRLRCRLAEREYELVLTDEQAKVQVDWLRRTYPRGDWAGLVRELVSANAAGLQPGQDIGVRVGRVEHDSSIPRRDARSAGGSVGGYGQVFTGVGPEQLVGTANESGLAARVTCWGPGAIHIHRASPEVIELACRDVLGRDMIKALITARGRYSQASLAELLAKLDRCDDKQKARLSERFTDQSTCYGLWVIAHDPVRSWYSLAIANRSRERAARAPDNHTTIVPRTPYQTWVW